MPSAAQKRCMLKLPNIVLIGLVLQFVIVRVALDSKGVRQRERKGLSSEVESANKTLKDRLLV